MPDEVLWHGSPVPFDIADVRPLTHFGTRKAAMMRLGEVLAKHGWRHDRPYWEEGRREHLFGWLRPVLVRIASPVEMSDGHDVLHPPREIGAMLRRARVLSSADEGDLRVNDPAPVLVAKLRERGFDGIVYENLLEDAGSRSWVVLDPGQVSVAGVPERITLGEIVAELAGDPGVGHPAP